MVELATKGKLSSSPRCSDCSGLLGMSRTGRLSQSKSVARSLRLWRVVRVDLRDILYAKLLKSSARETDHEAMKRET